MFSQFEKTPRAYGYAGRHDDNRRAAAPRSPPHAALPQGLLTAWARVEPRQSPALRRPGDWDKIALLRRARGGRDTMMRKPFRGLLCNLLLLTLLSALPGVSAEAPQAPAPADLRALAPEGTFLAPGEPPQYTENSYKSEHFSIEIRQVRDEEARSDAFVAEVRVASVDYLRRVYSLNKWKGDMRSIRTIAPDAGMVLAMTGDYASLFNAGLSVGNGVVYRKTDNRARDNCLVLSDGRMVTYPRQEKTAEEMLAEGVWHSFLFGPALLKDGRPIGEFTSPVRGKNPRSAIGYVSPGHYMLVVVDGRSSKSRGMTLEELSRFMSGLGCQAAYNLDGGQSAIMWFNGEIVNKPYKGGRRLTDVVAVGPPPAAGD